MITASPYKVYQVRKAENGYIVEASEYNDGSGKVTYLFLSLQKALQMIEDLETK